MAKSRIVVNGILLAVFAAVCIVAMEVLAFNIGQPKPGFINHDYQIQALFNDADGIPTAADVRVAGVGVGKVIDVGHDAAHPGYTVATLSITDDNANPVYSNGFATVRPKTLLGEKYVDLKLGDPTGEAIKNGGMLPGPQTSTSVENDQIFNAFDTQTRKQQQQVLQELNTALDGRAGDIQTILPQLDSVVRDLAPVAKVYEKDNPSVDQIFSNLDTLMKTLADEHVQLGQLLNNANVAAGAIASRDNSLIATLSEATNVQNELNRPLRATVQQQQQAIVKTVPSIDSQHAFIDQVLYPQRACGNKPCGIVEVLSGTLLGNIYYPGDQLTVSSHEGEVVANEYDSMFSVPTTNAKDPKSHSALNIVLSEHCDSAEVTLQPILGIDPTGQLGQTILKACQTASGHTTSGSATPAATDGVFNLVLGLGA
jgi:virulence factor Mce-like protein